MGELSDMRTVGVRLTADVNGYKTSMKQAADSTTAMDKAQEKAQRNTEKWQAVGMAAKVAGAAVAAGLLFATKAASNQEQALGSLTAVFKVNGAEMTKNAEKATQIGLSITEYSSAAAKLGSQLSNLGVDQKDLGGTTDDLIRKASDLSAQFGGTTQEAVDALGAAMRGEADPAERYGLALNVTAVNAEMAATGADKATAMMSLLNKQMAKSGAVGAWNREMDTAAARMQMAQKEFDNATATLGEALLPALAKAADAAGKLLGAFNGLPDGAKTAATFIIALGGTALLIGPRIATMTTAVINLKKSMDASGDAATATTSKVKGFAATAGKVAAVGGAATIAIPLLTELMNALTRIRFGETTTDAGMLEQQIIRLAQTGNTEIGRFGGSIDSLGDSLRLVGSEGWSKWNETVMRGGSELKTIEEEVGQLDAALAGMVTNGNADQAAAAFEMLVQQTIAAGGSLEDVQKALPGYAGALEESAIATENSAGASWADTEAKENQAEAVKKAVAQYEEYMATVQEALGLMSARDALIGQEDRLAESVKKNGNALRGYTEAAAANRAAMGDEVSKIADLVQAKYDETGSLKVANRVRRQHINNLRDAAAAAGYDREETERLLDKLNILKPIRTVVTVDGLTGAANEAERLARALTKVVNNSGLGSFGFGGQGRAAGGYISGPGTGTSDDIPAMLSNGEYVMTAKATKRLGVGTLDAMNYAGGGVVGYAGGGRVPRRGGGSGGGGRGGGGGRRGGGGGADLTVGAGAALAQVQKWREAVKTAADNVADLKEQARDYAESVAKNVLSAGGPGLFESFTKSGVVKAWTDLADAQDKVSAASRKVYEAQVAVNTSSPENRADALKALADAERDLADAQGEQASAQAAAQSAAPTSANILGRMRERANLVTAYATKVKSLMGKGLSMDLIKQMAGADPLEAGPVLDALLTMTPEALKELSDLDAAATSAAASVGSAVSDKVNKSGIDAAETTLTASEDELDKAIKAADKTLDKKWRKVLAKAGLSAEERASFRQSLRDNDGKLTRYWRQVLAKAGLGAEERAELRQGIDAADNTTRTEWREKLNATGLSAEERAELAEELANAKNPQRALRKFWIDELQETGLSAKESADLAAKIASAKDPSKALRKFWIDELQETGLSAKESSQLLTAVQSGNGTVGREWVNKLQETGLSARQANELVANINATGSVVDNQWTNNTRRIGLGARNASVGTDVDSEGYGNTNLNKFGNDIKKVGLGAKNTSVGTDVDSEGFGNANLTRFQGDTKKIGLGASGGGLGKQVNDEGFGNANLTKFGASRVDIGLGAKADLPAVRRASYAVALESWRLLKKSGLATFTKVPKPNPKDFGLAMGGMIVGPGTGTSDTAGVFALSNGEYVVRAASVKKYGADFLEAINAGRLASGGPVGFRTTTAASPAAGGVTLTTSGVPIVVRLDSRTVATGQLKLQRQSGGTVTLGG